MKYTLQTLTENLEKNVKISFSQGDSLNLRSITKDEVHKFLIALANIPPMEILDRFELNKQFYSILHSEIDYLLKAVGINKDFFNALNLGNAKIPQDWQNMGWDEKKLKDLDDHLGILERQKQNNLKISNRMFIPEKIIVKEELITPISDTAIKDKLYGQLQELLTEEKICDAPNTEFIIEEGLKLQIQYDEDKKISQLKIIDETEKGKSSEAILTSKNNVGVYKNWEISIRNSNQVVIKRKYTIHNNYHVSLSEKNVWLNFAKQQNISSETTNKLPNAGIKCHITIRYSDLDKLVDILCEVGIVNFKVMSTTAQKEFANQPENEQVSKTGTLYLFLDPSMSTKELVSVLNKIVEKCEQKGIQPGAPVRSDRYLPRTNSFAFLRNDLTFSLFKYDTEGNPEFIGLIANEGDLRKKLQKISESDENAPLDIVPGYAKQLSLGMVAIKFISDGLEKEQKSFNTHQQEGVDAVGPLYSPGGIFPLQTNSSGEMTPSLVPLWGEFFRKRDPNWEKEKQFKKTAVQLLATMFGTLKEEIKPMAPHSSYGKIGKMLESMPSTDNSAPATEDPFFEEFVLKSIEQFAAQIEKQVERSEEKSATQTQTISEEKEEEKQKKNLNIGQTHNF